MKKRKSIHDNWSTPKELYDKLNLEFNFDYDPCPLNATFDGLQTKWGKSNFVNPPYSRIIKEKFIQHGVKHCYENKGSICVFLLPVSTSTKIFHDLILPYANEIRFVKGRVKFSGVNTKGEIVSNKCGMHDSMIVVFGGKYTGVKSFIQND